MTLDPATQHLLEHQGRRMQHALHVELPPNRKLAAEIQKTVDGILDRRPRPLAVASDGEVLYDDASGWVRDQPGLTLAVNDTGVPEPVRADPNAPPPGTASGGVGLLDRPDNYWGDLNEAPDWNDR